MSGSWFTVEAVSLILLGDFRPRPIYSLSAAVGQCAVRLASLAGYKVVSTSSPRNTDFVKSLGASAVFDYRSPDVVAQIKAATGDSVKKALDTISDKNSQRITADALSPSGGEVVLVLQPVPEATSRTDVVFKRESAPTLRRSCTWL